MSGWEKAKEAAWSRFGHRWWKWIIGWHIAKRVLPAVAVAALIGGIVAAGWWLAHNETAIRTGRTAAITTTIAAALAWTVWAVRRWATPIYPPAWGLRACSALVTVAGLALVWRWT